MKVPRHVLASIAVGVATAFSAPAASAHAGPPSTFKSCGFFPHGGSIAKTYTLRMLFPSYINPTTDVIWLRLGNVHPAIAGGYVERWGAPHAYNLLPGAGHWFHSPAIIHRGGWRAVSVTIRPIPGRQTSLGGVFWVPSSVSRCEVTT
jgi:hypothetical protein